MLPEESGTLPHGPWTPMSIVNVRVPASEALREGWSEAEVCAEEVAAPLEPLRGDSPREPVTPSRGNCQQERRIAPSGSSYRQGRRKAHREATPQRKAKHHRDEQRAEPAASRRATCRTDIIGKQLPPRKPQCSIGKQLHSAKHGSIGTSNLPNQHHREAAAAREAAKQHREADVFANNGTKWGGVEGMRGSNLACFLKNFVSNYIVIFLMMLFRVHL